MPGVHASRGIHLCVRETGGNLRYNCLRRGCKVFAELSNQVLVQGEAPNYLRREITIGGSELIRTKIFPLVEDCKDNNGI